MYNIVKTSVHMSCGTAGYGGCSASFHIQNWYLRLGLILLHESLTLNPPGVLSYN